MSRIFLTQHIRPAGGIPLVGLMLAVAVVCLGTASQLIQTPAGTGTMSAVQETALPTAIEGLGELPLPPR